jgi:hypothetical protein
MLVSCICTYLIIYVDISLFNPTLWISDITIQKYLVWGVSLLHGGAIAMMFIGMNIRRDRTARRERNQRSTIS